MDFTGDMPILLGPDGPSLGGFVCPAVIAQAELWKIGQLRAGDTVRFRRISNSQAEEMEQALDEAIRTLNGNLPQPESDIPEPAILHRSGSTVYRAAGDRYLLIEVGPNELNLDLRMRVHATRKTSPAGTAERNPRYHAGHPIAADPLRQPRSAPRGTHRLPGLLRASAVRSRRHQRPDRAPSIFHCRGKILRHCSRYKNTCSRFEPTLRGAPATSNSSGESMDWIRSKPFATSSSTRAIWFWVLAMFTSALRSQRRSIRATAS